MSDTSNRVVIDPGSPPLDLRVVSARAYSREEIEEERRAAAVDENWNPGNDGARRLLATVDALDSQILAVQNRACEVEMEWAAKLDARDAEIAENREAMREAVALLDRVRTIQVHQRGCWGNGQAKCTCEWSVAVASMLRTKAKLESALGDSK